jgi:hypothetical protein
MQKNENFFYTEEHLTRLKASRWAGEGVWFQIHTNGGVVTFAMFTRQEVPRDKGDLVVLAEVGVFQKLQVDITTGTAEVFGREEFDDRYEASERLREARDTGI